MSKFREFLGLGPSRREIRRAAEEAARIQWAQRTEHQTAAQTRLLQTMVEVYNSATAGIWGPTDIGGWNPGIVIRANDKTGRMIYEMHYEHERRNGHLYPNGFYGITVDLHNPQLSRYAFRYPTTKYIQAVFDLTILGDSKIPAETKQVLSELQKIDVQETPDWQEFPETPAIRYMESLLVPQK